MRSTCWCARPKASFAAHKSIARKFTARKVLMVTRSSLIFGCRIFERRTWWHITHIYYLLTVTHRQRNSIHIPPSLLTITLISHSSSLTFTYHHSITSRRARSTRLPTTSASWAAAHAPASARSRCQRTSLAPRSCRVRVSPSSQRHPSVSSAWHRRDIGMYRARCRCQRSSWCVSHAHVYVPMPVPVPVPVHVHVPVDAHLRMHAHENR